MIHFIYAVTDKDGRIYKTNIKPVKWKTVWLESRNDMLSKKFGEWEIIHEEEALRLCDRIPEWEDSEPTEIKYV